MPDLDGITYNLGYGITAGSIARGSAAKYGGTGAYAGFNACHYVGDTTAHVHRCRSMLAAHIGVTEDALVIPRQSHTTNVVTVGSMLSLPDLQDVDGLITHCEGLVLCINTADCVPVLMADAGSGVIAAVHAGWRGTAGGILIRAVDAMVAGGADVSRIRIAFGPSICSGCFEVGMEVADRFDSRNVIRTFSRPHVDLRGELTCQLTDRGVKADNIHTGAPCSRCNSGQWCSARSAGISSARTISFITINHARH